MTKIVIFLLTIIAFTSISFNFYFLNKLQKNESTLKVLGVIDGDTIVLENKVRLRLRQLDAPELEFCGGQQAKELLQKLVENKKIIIREQIPDQQGRAMALIYADDTFVNLEMLKSGWVRFHHDQTEQNDLLKEIGEKVRVDKKGIFSNLCYQKENIENPKCRIKGNIDKNSKDRKYYYPGCNQYNFTIVEKDIGENWFCSEKEAEKAGFKKAETCKKAY